MQMRAKTVIYLSLTPTLLAALGRTQSKEKKGKEEKKAVATRPEFAIWMAFRFVWLQKEKKKEEEKG